MTEVEIADALAAALVEQDRVRGTPAEAEILARIEQLNRAADELRREKLARLTPG